jgi:tight adherence protein B
MLLIIFFIFLLIFGAIAAIAVKLSGEDGSSEQARAALDAALNLSQFSLGEEVIDIRKKVLFSSMPWLNTILAEIKTATELQHLLKQADLNWTPARLLLSTATLLLTVGLLVHWKTALWLPSLLLGLLAGAAPLYYVLHKRQQRFLQFQRALPDALDLMVSALRGGHSTFSALGVVANEAPEPIGRELRQCFEEQNFGMEFRAALNNLVDRVPLQDVRIMATAMVIQKESGGNLAEILDKTAMVIRERFKLLQQIRVNTAQGRLTGWILSLLPVGLAIIMSSINPSHMRVLFTRPVGQKMIWAGVAMNLVGLLMIRKIVRIRV